MKLSMLPIVLRTIDARNKAKATLASLASDQFVVTIGGERQDDAMRAVARPSLERELRGRLASLERDLDAYGVTVDADGQVSLLTA